MKERLRKTLSKPGLLHAAHSSFKKIDDTVLGRGFTLVDYLMSGLAVFSLKYPSLLAFDQAVHDEDRVRSNLGSLYRIQNVPSDSGMRKRLDELDPQRYAGCFQEAVWQVAKRQGALRVRVH